MRNINISYDDECRSKTQAPKKSIKLFTDQRANELKLSEKFTTTAFRSNSFVSDEAPQIFLAMEGQVYQTALGDKSSSILIVYQSMRHILDTV